MRSIRRFHAGLDRSTVCAGFFLVFLRRFFRIRLFSSLGNSFRRRFCFRFRKRSRTLRLFRNRNRHGIDLLTLHGGSHISR